MKFWVGVTDPTWFEFLSNLAGVDEVNFWHPGGSPPFTSLPEGTPFLFKLKAPFHHIAGGGFFVKYEQLPLPVAWDAFGEKNGAATLQELEGLILPRRAGSTEGVPEIGCSILAQPFFFAREDWIPVGEAFAATVVRGKTFESSESGGSRLWELVQLRLASRATPGLRFSELHTQYGPPTLVKPRRGQGAFKALVTNAYSRRCAITGESTLPVLEAAHIRPFAQEGFNNTFNGLLLRSDFHKLFDIGLVTVTPDRKVLVSSRIKEQWYNGKAYYQLHGEPLAVVPKAPADQPRADLLAWHNDNVFDRKAG